MRTTKKMTNSTDDITKAMNAIVNWAFDKKTQLPIEDRVMRLSADVAYIVTHTAILVHCSGPHENSLTMLVNTKRGQKIPPGQVRYTSGNVIEFQDIGAPQPGAPVMTVQELILRVWDIATELGLEIEV
jgi:hypothetical protein